MGVAGGGAIGLTKASVKGGAAGEAVEGVAKGEARGVARGAVLGAVRGVARGRVGGPDSEGQARGGADFRAESGLRRRARGSSFPGFVLRTQTRGAASRTCGENTERRVNASQTT